MTIGDISPVDFLHYMTDEDLSWMIKDGEIERFCISLTLDLNKMQNNGVTNQA
tara:strand:- start:126 stop:284 length:159 start_codon:yes stop_codon:yes gene_type:complete